MSLSAIKFDPVIFDDLIFDTLGDQALMYALSDVARSGATRSNYHDPRCYVSIGGTYRQSGVRYGSITITDVLNEVANTATMTVDPEIQPLGGQEVIITLGSKNNRTRLFAGSIVGLQKAYDGISTNIIYNLSLVDYTWGLNKRKVNRRYLNESASDIAADLVESFTDGTFTVGAIEDDLDVVDEITFTNEDVTDALTRLANRIGAYWYLDYLKDLHFFTEELTQQPQTLRIGNAGFRSFLYAQDLSQFVTRVYGEGGGVNAITEVASGETILPVQDAIGWYNPAGGLLTSGPQRFTYTGYDEGGAGSLVGPGAAPATAPVVAMAAGAGVTSGTHDWAVTFVTASGESIVSPVGTLTVGTVAAPSVAPSVALAVGTGVDTGNHYYSITFVAGGGETTAGTQSLTVSCGPVTGGTISAPSSSPSLSGPSSGGSVDPGSHDYSVTFYNGAGETTGSTVASITVPTFSHTGGAPSASCSGQSDGVTGNLSYGTGQSYWYTTTFTTSAGETTPGGITTGAVPKVTSAGGFGVTGPTAGGSVDTGLHFYYWTLVTGSGETDSIGSNSISTTSGNNTVGLTKPLTGDARVTHYRVYRSKAGTSSPAYLVGTFAIGANGSDTASDASLPGTVLPTTDTASTGQMSLTGIPTGPSGTTGRKIYRGTIGSSTPLKLVTTIADNVTTTYTDNTADGSLGANEPSVNTATFAKTVALSSIPLGPGGTSGRKIYRSAAGGGQLKLVTTIANNSTTTYNDTTADSGLGANIPVSNTTGTTTNYNQVSLTGIPLGSAAVTARKVYRTAAGGSQLKLVATIADNSTTVYTDSTADGSLGANIPVSNTTVANQVSITSIAIGPSGTTQRKLYRTTAGGSTLKLLATIANNSTTTYTDSTADGALGANAPSSDTSGLAQAEGQVLAGSTTLPVAGPGLFPTEGWAVIGNGTQVIRYTGKTGSTLTGIPASGVGAILATIAYNSNVTAAPQLKGIPATGDNAIKYMVLKGDPVNVLVQRDDTPAQVSLAALIGGDGVQEAYLSDNRMSETEMVNRCDAYLAARARVMTTASYETHDLNTRSGYTVPVDLTYPTAVTGEFLIQRVTISGVQQSGRIMPWHAVEASSERFSLEDLLRRERRRD